MYISSTWPFSSPVVRHCLMNCGWERLAINMVTTAESGIVTSAMAASSGEIRNIITTTPTTVRTEVMSWASVCASVCARLSMSLVTRESTSPRLCESTYFSGTRVSLSATLLRSRNMVCWVMIAVIRDCCHDSKAEAI